MRDIKPVLTADHHLTASASSSPALPFFPGENVSDDSTFFSSPDSTILQPLIPLPYEYFSTSLSPNFYADDYPPLAYDTPAHHFLQFPDNFSSSSCSALTSPLYLDSQAAFDSNINLLDFFSKPAPDLFCNPGTSSSFTHLPHLHSIEHAQLNHSSSSSSARNKRARFDYAAASSSQSLDSILQNNFNFQSYTSAPPSVTPSNELPRQRRPRISDKTRSLQKLMPSDKKMDTATLLEDAYKYVEFLQAQIKALQWMPVGSSFSGTGGGALTEVGAGVNNNVLGSLETLNRQQLLQVMVNSPVAQTMLYSKGFCVFSHEQLLLLRRIAQKKTSLLEQMLFDPSKSCR